MEKHNLQSFFIELPAPTGMQPQTESLRDFANSEDIRSPPKSSAATAVFCFRLTSRGWSQSCAGPGTSSHRTETTNKRKTTTHTPHKTTTNHTHPKTTKRLVPRLPRQHPESWLRYPGDISLVTNYLLQFPAFLHSKSKKHFAWG